MKTTPILSISLAHAECVSCCMNASVCVCECACVYHVDNTGCRSFQKLFALNCICVSPRDDMLREATQATSVFTGSRRRQASEGGTQHAARSRAQTMSSKPAERGRVGRDDKAAGASKRGQIVVGPGCACLAISQALLQILSQ